ncbi:hypothetical protein GCM10025877_02260 [Agromyces mangrovi Wang et al. 2018]|nr:hypothetical protein GCM10025877_02260 [Agromyces mangrovi]
MPRTVRLAVIPGDGIGPEVVEQALRALDSAIAGEDVALERTEFSLGAARYLETGDVLTDADLTSIAGHDAILLGAVGGKPGDPRLAGANIERGLLLRLRFSLDHYVNLRPSVLYPGVQSPSPTRATSTSSSCGRAPRVRTSATAAPSASAPRRRSPTRCR